ncbi:MAG: hypothetical protein IH959_04835 [Chloroflexi bacterium]|nr:hypothetical protein [Chloroflexota bacterium]
MSFSLKPRRVWTGMAVPGKKMIRLLNLAEGRLDAGKNLLALYESPGEALLLTATAIELLPSSGLQFGPAARDLHSPLELRAWYGAILTDIRDFLKLRFRVKGSSTSPEGHEASPETAVRYSISVLHAQSRMPALVDWDAMGRIRDVLLDAGEKLASQDELEIYAPMIEAFRELRGQPPKWRD